MNDLQRWYNRGLEGPAPAVPGFGVVQEVVKPETTRATQMAVVGSGVGELAAAELAKVSGGRVVVSPEAAVAPRTHE